jgi:hypothetical protein
MSSASEMFYGQMKPATACKEEQMKPATACKEEQGASVSLDL